MSVTIPHQFNTITQLFTIYLVPRTFGRIKKFLPILLGGAFKAGIITTMIFILVLLALKNLLIGKTILLLNVGFILFKIIAFFDKLKGHGHHQYATHKSDYGGWNPHKNIHVHIHNSGGGAGGAYETKEFTPFTGTLPLSYGTASHQSYRRLSE